jgi:hypothetical protein
MIIYARSPYTIEINEAAQVGSKLEIFLWNTPNSIPATATYTLSKKVASNEQRVTIYNISPYIKEYIDNIVSTDGTNNQWCNVSIKRYKETSAGAYTLVDTTTYAGVDGYIDYIGGYNQTNPLNNYCLLADNSKEIQYKLGNIPYVNVLINNALGDKLDVEYKDKSGNNVITNSVFGTGVAAGKYMYKVPLTTSSSNYDNGTIATLKYFVGGTLTYSSVFNVTPICESKYTPVVCSFINRFGGWQFLTFFKAQTNQLTVTSTMYNLLPSNYNYNFYKGQSKSFNYNARQIVSLNTGFVPENYSDLIQDLMLSEVVLLDNKPVTLKTNQTSLKTTIQDKNINYTIDFEYAYNLLNNVI